MLMILSPAKTFNTLTEGITFEPSALLFQQEVEQLMGILSEYSKEELGKLMKMSETLSEHNYNRIHQFFKNGELATYAVDYFFGEAYKGLDAKNLSVEGRGFAQDHLCILSGLYGVIRPMDVIKPYRLEMGTRLPNSKGRNLYDFWRDCLTTSFEERLAQTDGDQVLLNLASDEYSKALDLKTLGKTYGVVTVTFKTKKGEKYQAISMHAKKARGQMARYILENQISTIDGLMDFNEDGYSFNEILSSQDELIFVREI